MNLQSLPPQISLYIYDYKKAFVALGEGVATKKLFVFAIGCEREEEGRKVKRIFAPGIGKGILDWFPL